MSGSFLATLTSQAIQKKTTIAGHRWVFWLGLDLHQLCGDPRQAADMPDLHPDMSSGAAEIYAASVALTEVMHLSYIVDEMGEPMELPLQLLVDNTTAIAFSKGNVRRSKLKHIDVRQQWVEWLRDKGLVKLSHVSTKSNPADFFTKILDYDTFNHLRSIMMLEKPIDSVGARTRL